MSVGKIIMSIIASILVFFGVLFIWSAFSPEGQTSSIIVGIITVVIGLALFFIVFRKKASAASDNQNVTVNIDLPGDVKLESLKCKSCGGTLAPENIKLVAGAPTVTCPYCNTTYQLTEEPKW
jgi:Na+/melibiose symporter-like transporter